MDRCEGGIRRERQRPSTMSRVFLLWSVLQYLGPIFRTLVFSVTHFYEGLEKSHKVTITIPLYFLLHRARKFGHISVLDCAGDHT